MPRLAICCAALLLVSCAETRRSSNPELQTGAAAASAADSSSDAAGDDSPAVPVAADGGAPSTRVDARAGDGGAARSLDAGGSDADAARPLDDGAAGGSAIASACAMAGCDPEEASCSLAQGAAECRCADGYRDVFGDGRRCEPIDECLLGLAAADGEAVLRHGRRERVHLVQLPPEKRAPVLREYLRIAPSGTVAAGSEARRGRPRLVFPSCGAQRCLG